VARRVHAAERGRFNPTGYRPDAVVLCVSNGEFTLEELCHLKEKFKEVMEKLCGLDVANARRDAIRAAADEAKHAYVAVGGSAADWSTPKQYEALLYVASRACGNVEATVQFE